MSHLILYIVFLEILCPALPAETKKTWYPQSGEYFLYAGSTFESEGLRPFDYRIEPWLRFRSNKNEKFLPFVIRNIHDLSIPEQESQRIENIFLLVPLIHSP
jgi:hypothetical protein